ncbi:hypothetical protein SKAU_G00362870 [Synaphobranchus kaupii]|uniref:Uncharacterized protein n=1 Tax=Synaphobranchus kaupii TaxID=118154 RepID=A0A9Q1EIK1_SYNKA|nr:hypothetical protein SKAU_G00362870 [Synaphobranchus kaupii]
MMAPVVLNPSKSRPIKKNRGQQKKQDEAKERGDSRGTFGRKAAEKQGSFGLSSGCGVGEVGESSAL